MRQHPRVELEVTPTWWSKALIHSRIEATMTELSECEGTEAMSQIDEICSKCGGKGCVPTEETETNWAGFKECTDCKGRGLVPSKDSAMCNERFNGEWRCVMAKGHAGEHSAETKDYLSTVQGEPLQAEPFPAGTPEAIRDAKLRRHLFDCVENASPKTTWHYERALRIITAYRKELSAEKNVLHEQLMRLENEGKDVLLAALNWHANQSSLAETAELKKLAQACSNLLRSSADVPPRQQRFEWALQMLRDGYAVRRKDWRRYLVWTVRGFAGRIAEVWPSNQMALYRPDSEDLVATDWMRAE